VTYEDPKIDESVKEFEKQVDENRKKSFSGKLDPKTIMWCGFGIVGILWFVYTEKMDIKLGVGMVAVVLYLLYYLSQQVKGMAELDEQVWTNIIEKKLRWKQIYTSELPKGTLKMDIKGARPFRGGIPWIREKGFEITKHNNVVIYYIVAGDPFIANILNISEAKQGYDPSQKRDVEYIPSEALESQKRRDKEIYKIRRG